MVSLRPMNGRQTLFQLAGGGGGGGGGIFQGDTLSPLFLVAFTPIIKGTQCSPFSGFCLLLPTPTNSGGLPERNSFVYTLWNEPQSEEPCGWYLAKVTYISDDGNAVIRYKRGSLEKQSTCSMSHGFKQRVMGNGSFQFIQSLRLWEPQPQNPKSLVHNV